MGERNGAFKTGAWTNEAIAERRRTSNTLKTVRCFLRDLRLGGGPRD